MKEGLTELRSTSSGGLVAWLRRTFGSPAPRAFISATAAVHLGGPLEVEWRVEDARDATLVSVSLVGSELARKRQSSRTGIFVVTERNDFFVVRLDHRQPGGGAAVVSGHGATVVPAGLVPSLPAKLNEIAWAVVVEVLHGSALTMREEFSVTVLPVAT